MTATSTRPLGADESRFLTAARTGDAGAFAMATEPYRRELHVHCYRMLASFEDAQDLTQEVFLRAWRRRDTFEGRSSLRAWLYKIATNACLDFLERRPTRVPVAAAQDGALPEVRYVQPYPDRLLDEVPGGGDEPGDAVVAKETIELAFLVAIQHLPPRQRAALILRDVLGWTAKQTAAALDSSVASANSALQRARATMREQLPDRRLQWRSAARRELTASERTLLQRYMDAHVRGDLDGLAALLRDDVRFAMPPDPGSWIGRDVIVQGWADGGFGSEGLGRWRCVATWANRHPAIAGYLRGPADERYRLFAFDVLTIEDGRVTEIVAFTGGALAAFDLPATMDDR